MYMFLMLAKSRQTGHGFAPGVRHDRAQTGPRDQRPKEILELFRDVLEREMGHDVIL